MSEGVDGHPGRPPRHQEGIVPSTFRIPAAEMSGPYAALLKALDHPLVVPVMG